MKCRELCLNTQNKTKKNLLNNYSSKSKSESKSDDCFPNYQGNMQHNFDFDLDLCEVLLQTPKKSYRLICTYTFERVKWSICAFTRMTDNVIHC